MGTLAYCSKKFKISPQMREQLEADAKKYREQGFSNHESELQVAQDSVDFIDKEHESIILQSEGLVREAIKQFEAKPGQWFKWPFVLQNKTILENKIRELYNSLHDTQSLIDSGLYKYDQPIPKAGGIMAAVNSSKYATDKAYKKWVDGKIKQIQTRILEANRSRVMLLGIPLGDDLRISREMVAGLPEPFYKAGSEEASQNVAAPYAAEVDRVWMLEAQRLYGEHNLGDIGIREALQNSMDAVMESIEQRVEKSGSIDINTISFASDESATPDEFPNAYTQGFEVIDNGIGMNSDLDIRDKFLTLAGPGGKKAGRFGGFGIAKAVILKPVQGTAWDIETNGLYYNNEMAENKRKVADLDVPRRGTKIWVRAPKGITSPKGRRYVETTVPPKNVKIKFNGDVLDNPFLGMKPKVFNYDLYTDRTYEDADGKTVDGKVHYTVRYYSKPPTEYENTTILRLDDEQTGAKLTQGIGYAGMNFQGALIVDIKTKATPDQAWYPLQKSRQSLQPEARRVIDELVDKFKIDKTSAKRDVEAEMIPLSSRPEWKSALDIIVGGRKGRMRDDYQRFEAEMEEILADNIEARGNEVLGYLPKGYNQTSLYTPLTDLEVKIDKGYKGYKGGTTLHAKIIHGYEATARLLAHRLSADVGKLYPMLSKTDEDGGYILAEYQAVTGNLGFNYVAIPKSTAKSPLAMAFHLFTSGVHELTHKHHMVHDEQYSSARERNERVSSDVFPQVVRIAEAILGKKDSDLMRIVTKEVPIDKILTKTEVIERIITKSVEVPVEKLIEVEVRKFMAQQQRELEFPVTERNTRDDEKLYRPTKPEEGERQLGLFGRTMAGIDARQLSVIDPQRPWGSAGQPITPRAPEDRDRSIQLGPSVDVANKDDYFYGIPVDSPAYKVLAGYDEVTDHAMGDYSDGEIRGLSRMLGAPIGRTKAETYNNIVDQVNVIEQLAEYDTSNGVAELATKKTMAQLREMAKLARINPTGSKMTLATKLMRHYLQTFTKTLTDYEKFYSETGRDMPAEAQGREVELKRISRNIHGTDKDAAIYDAIAGLDDQFESGVAMVSYKLIMDKVPARTDFSRDDVINYISSNLDKLLQGVEVKNVNAVPDADRAEWFPYKDTFFDAIGLKDKPMINPVDMATKIDSTSFVTQLDKHVHDLEDGDRVGIQLGLMAIESPKVKKSLRIAYDKLDYRIVRANSDRDLELGLKLAGPKMVMRAALDIVGESEGKPSNNIRYQAVVNEHSVNPAKVRNQELLNTIFFGQPAQRESGPIDKYMATRAVKEAYRKRYMRDQGITLDDIKRLFKNQDVLQLQNGNIRMTTKGGAELTIKSVDSVDTDNASFYVTYGRKPATGELATGRYRDGKIDIHKDLSNNWTLTHETLHWMEDVGIVTSKEVDMLRDHIRKLNEQGKWDPANKDDIGGDEDRANYVSLKMAIRDRKTGAAGVEGLINRMVQKIKDILDGFVGMFRLTPQSLVRDVATGRVYKREATDITDPTAKYSVKSPQEEALINAVGAKRAAEIMGEDLSADAMTTWQKLGRWWRNYREIGVGQFEDTTSLERLLFTPLHYFAKIPALKAIAEDGMVRSDNYYKILHWIERNRRGQSRIQAMEKLRKSNKKEYQRVSEYLDDRDINKIGYKVKRGVSPEESADQVFDIINPDGKTVAQEGSLEDGRRVAIQLELKDMADAGYSEQAISVVRDVRIITDSGFNIMTGAIRDLVRQYAKTNEPLPKVATWVDGERVEVDMKVALAEMGDMRGYYMPRIRRPGRFTMYAKKKGAHPILEHFELKATASKMASDLEGEGYTVNIEPINKVPEDVFQLAGKIIGFQTMMNEALDKVGKGMKKGETVETMRLLKKVELQMGKALAEGVANVFQGRGVRSHMIMRNDATGVDVWKGYEQDLTQRMAKYARGLAAGEAKKKMALDMLRHFTGTDVSWQQYSSQMKDVGLKPEYKDYLIMVKGRRVDPINQKNAFHDGMTYMQDMLRNDEFVDRFIGMVKGVAVTKYLAGRVAAPLVNLTALVTSVPATFMGIGKIPLHKVPGLLADGMKGWRSYRQYLKGKGTMEAWERDLYAHIEEKGWHTAQYNKEALSVLKTKLGNKYDNMIEVLMMGFGATEMLNRVSTIAGAYKGLREMGMRSNEWKNADVDGKAVIEKGWMALAKEVSDKAHGVYSKANRPHYARGANVAARLAQSFYVFKTFSHNYLQTMYDLGFKAKDRKALLYMALSPALIGGATASPLIAMMFQAFGLVPGSPDEPEEAFYEFLEANMGEKVEQLARLGIFGAGGYGVSLKGSLEIQLMDLPTSLKDLTGAPGSMVVDLWKGMKSISRGDYLKGIESISPNFIGSMSKAYREKTQGLTTGTNAPIFYGKEQVKLDWMEALIRGLSFNPARIARIREKQWKEKKVEANLAESNRDVYAKVKGFFLQPARKRSKVDWLKIIQEIEVYNEHVTKYRRRGKHYSYITSKSIKNNLRRAFRPSKKERMR